MKIKKIFKKLPSLSRRDSRRERAASPSAAGRPAETPPPSRGGSGRTREGAAPGPTSAPKPPPPSPSAESSGGQPRRRDAARAERKSVPLDGSVVGPGAPRIASESKGPSRGGGGGGAFQGGSASAAAGTTAAKQTSASGGSSRVPVGPGLGRADATPLDAAFPAPEPSASRAAPARPSFASAGGAAKAPRAESSDGSVRGARAPLPLPAAASPRAPIYARKGAATATGAGTGSAAAGNAGPGSAGAGSAGAGSAAASGVSGPAASGPPPPPALLSSALPPSRPASSLPSARAQPRHRRSSSSSVSSLDAGASPEERSEGAVERLLAKTEGTVSQLLAAHAQRGGVHPSTTYHGGKHTGHTQSASFRPSGRAPPSRARPGGAFPSTSASPPPLPGEFPDAVVEDPLFGPSAGGRVAARQALGADGSFSSDDSFSSAISRLPFSDLSFGAEDGGGQPPAGVKVGPRRGHSRRGSWADPSSPIRGRRSPSRLSFASREELFGTTADQGRTSGGGDAAAVNAQNAVLRAGSGGAGGVTAAAAAANAAAAAAFSASLSAAAGRRAPFVVSSGGGGGGARGASSAAATAAFPWEESTEEARGNPELRRTDDDDTTTTTTNAAVTTNATTKSAPSSSPARGRGGMRRGSRSSRGGSASPRGKPGAVRSRSPRGVASSGAASLGASTATASADAAPPSPRSKGAGDGRETSSPRTSPRSAAEGSLPRVAVSRPSYAEVASGQAHAHSVAAGLIARISSGSHRGAELVARLSGRSRSRSRSRSASPRSASAAAARAGAREAALASMSGSAREDAELSGPSNLSHVSNAAAPSEGMGGKGFPPSPAPGSAPSPPAVPLSRPTLGTRSSTLPGSLFPPLPRAEEALQLLEMLSPEERARVDPGMASRYVRATNGDLNHSLKRVRESLEWLAEDKPRDSTCSACGRAPKSHYMQVFGWDRFSRPSIYSCLSVASDRDLEHNRRHMVACFEQAIAAMPPGVESWGWVLDMHGFGMRDLDPRLAYAFLKISASYYPERLGHAYIIGAPTLFSTFWKGISPFIDPKTKEKITFANFSKTKKAGGTGPAAAAALRDANAKLVKSLERHYPTDSIDWLLAEMADNRVKSVADVKYFPVRDLVALVETTPPERGGASPAQRRSLERAKTKRLEAKRKAAGNSNAKFLNPDHDHLGTPAYIRDLQGRPDRLPPHLFTRAADQAKHNVGQP